MKLLQALLSALVPLFTRRVIAAERQAAAAEDLNALLRQYLGYADPGFLDLMAGRIPVAEEAAGPGDAEADHGPSRDLKAARLEELRLLWEDRYGEMLDDERLVEEYDRLYEDAEARLDADRAVGEVAR